MSYLKVHRGWFQDEIQAVGTVIPTRNRLKQPLGAGFLSSQNLVPFGQGGVFLCVLLKVEKTKSASA